MLKEKKWYGCGFVLENLQRALVWSLINTGAVYLVSLFIKIVENPQTWVQVAPYAVILVSIIIVSFILIPCKKVVEWLIFHIVCADLLIFYALNGLEFLNNNAAINEIKIIPGMIVFYLICGGVGIYRTFYIASIYQKIYPDWMYYLLNE